jgi:hypothetical protein
MLKVSKFLIELVAESLRWLRLAARTCSSSSSISFEAAIPLLQCWLPRLA